MTSPDTRTRILDAAEELFAATGFDGTSIRQITRSAGVNVAAIHYHFGSKEAVLRGVTDRIVGPLNQRRFALLDEVLAASDHPDVGAVLDAFIRPDFETLLALRPSAARFLGRTYADQTPWIQQMAGEQFEEAGTRFFPVLASGLTHLDPEELAWRMRQAAALIVHTFATWPEDGMTDAESENSLRRLVDFLTAAISSEREGA
jgi:AcrR family transcriptional regulator